MPNPTFFADAIVAFQERLRESAKERVSRKTTQINRRLDSLARLLEQNLICTAVTYDNESKKILISCNKISEKNDKIINAFKQINNVITLLADHEASIKQIVTGLTEIITLNFCQEERYLYNSLPGDSGSKKGKVKEVITKLLLDLFYSGESTKEWRKQIVDMPLYQGLKAENIETAFLTKLLNKIARISRDFIKLRKLIFSVTHDPDDSALQIALKERRTEIIQADEPDVHAEMRLINKLATSNTTINNYIGISKLCCDKCGLAVDVMQVETRGKHGQGYGWPLPKFIKDDMTIFKKYVGDLAYGLYEKLAPQEKQAFLEHIKSDVSAAFPNENARHGRYQDADTSSSDGEFGVLDSDKELDNNATEFPFYLIWALRKIKQDHPSRLKNLLRGGIGLQEAVCLYINDERKFLTLSGSKEKVSAMRCKNAIKLIQKDEDNDDLLSELFDINPNLFWFVVNDKDNLLDEYSIQEIKQRYLFIVNCPKNKFFDNDSDQESPFSQDENIFNRIIDDLKKEYGYDYSSSSSSNRSSDLLGNAYNTAGYGSDDDDNCHAECEPYQDDDNDESFAQHFSSLHI